MNNITNITQKLIKIVIIFGIVSEAFALEFKGKMQNKNGMFVDVALATTREVQTKGLSGIKSKQFKTNQAMLFVNSEMAPRKFWMPDTYFNLDIIFLDNNLKIVGIDRNAHSHPGMKEPPIIYRTGVYNAQYILETKANSPFSKSLRIGDELKYLGKPSLSEIVQGIHLEQ
jgi:uncharacterized membrane protein (UPF0127 family)